jgi:hypothetical protein
MSKMKLVYGTGRAQVEFSDAQRATFEAVLDTIIPNTMDVFHSETARVLDYATEHAPVKTGFFKRSLERGVRVESLNMVGGYVRSRDRKAYHVRWGEKSFGFRMGRRVVDDIIYKPGREGVEEMAAALADDLAIAAARGR